MKILFLHGLGSTPGGLKPTYLIDHGHEVFNPRLPHDDFDESIRIAQANYDQHHPDVVVGSSRDHVRALEVQRLLQSKYPNEPHADCDVWAIWQMMVEV